jgi:hypothetical protein
LHSLECACLQALEIRINKLSKHMLLPMLSVLLLLVLLL